MDWKDEFFRMLVAGEMVDFRNSVDKTIVARLLDRIESDAEIQSRLTSLPSSELRAEIRRMLEEERSRRD